MKVELLFVNEGHLGSIYDLTIGKNANEIISCGGDGLMVSWDFSNPNKGVVMAKVEDKIISALRWEDHQFISCLSGAMYKLNIESNKPPERIKMHKGAVYKMLVIENQLLSVGADGLLCIWNPFTFEWLDSWHISQHRLRSIAYCKLKNELFIGDSNGTLHKITWPNIQSIHRFGQIHQSTIFSMLYQDTSDTLVTGGMDARLQFHKINNENIQSQSIKAHWFSINDLVELENVHAIATASRDKSIRIWDPIQRTLLKDLSSGFEGLQKHSVNTLVWSTEHNVLFSAGDDKKIFAWKITYPYDI